MNKAVFLDRDGTINVDKHYVYKIEDFEFINGVPQAIKSLNKNGYKVIVISNQSGIARGFYTIADVEKLHKYMDSELAKINAKIDAYYICPHHPDFSGECECRKPKTGLIKQAIKNFDIDISQSYLVGDKEIDMECGNNAGIKTFITSETWQLKNLISILTENGV
ncbi:MAG: D-glycero-beta-D-manno-heptose 1,7-bisphosphate 7-phosphatase [Fibromonadales bacterium]|nr:D-glycero-beta-D-manno-heptose 1,7-bisphosphate 7-phosphatase [Fibromonadales bacterium]